MFYLKQLTSQPSSSNATPDDASILSDDSLDSAMCLQHEQEIEKLKKERDEAIGKWVQVGATRILHSFEFEW